MHLWIFYSSLFILQFTFSHQREICHKVTKKCGSKNSTCYHESVSPSHLSHFPSLHSMNFLNLFKPFEISQRSCNVAPKRKVQRRLLFRLRCLKRKTVNGGFVSSGRQVTTNVVIHLSSYSHTRVHVRVVVQGTHLSVKRGTHVDARMWLPPARWARPMDFYNSIAKEFTLEMRV